MSENEKLLLIEIRKTMLRIFIPIAIVIILGIGTAAIALPYRMKTMEAKVNTINEHYVDTKMFMVVTSGITKMNELLATSLEKNKELNIEEFARINKRIDDVIKETYPHKTRGGTATKTN